MSEDKGRPTKYREEYNTIAERLALGGYSDERIAQVLGVSKQTFYEWQKKHPDFLDCLMKGKELAVAEVSVSLFKRAKGYETEEVRQEIDPATKTITKITKTKKKIPPDTSAATLFLKAKNPKHWNVKQEVDVTSSDGSMTPRTLDSFYEKSE